MISPRVSIILLVKNEMKNLPRLIATLSGQKFRSGFEVIAVDSGSNDGSVEFLELQEKIQKKFKVRFFRIKPREFGHGKTRNLATEKAKGKIFVFLTADALPLKNDWLEKLTRPLESNFAAAFSRLIPYSQGTIFDEYFDSVIYPNKDRVISNENNRELFLADYMYYSNVSGAIKKEVFIKIPFDRDKIMSEDQWWGKKAIEAGYKIKYVCKSVVMHSHTYAFGKFFDRQFTSGYSLIGIRRFLILRLIIIGIPYLFGEGYYILSKGKVFSFLYMFFYEGFRFFSFVVGILGDKIPIRLRNKLFYYLPLKKT